MNDDVEAVANVLFNWRDTKDYWGRERSDAMAAAILDALRSRGWRHVEEGWTVVPKEPTEAMVATGRMKMPSQIHYRQENRMICADIMAPSDPSFICASSVYRAMLSAVEKEK